MCTKKAREKKRRQEPKTNKLHITNMERKITHKERKKKKTQKKEDFFPAWAMYFFHYYYYNFYYYIKLFLAFKTICIP